MPKRKTARGVHSEVKASLAVVGARDNGRANSDNPVKWSISEISSRKGSCVHIPDGRGIIWSAARAKIAPKPAPSHSRPLRCSRRKVTRAKPHTTTDKGRRITSAWTSVREEPPVIKSKIRNMTASQYCIVAFVNETKIRAKTYPVISSGRRTQRSDKILNYILNSPSANNLSLLCRQLFVCKGRVKVLIGSNGKVQAVKIRYALA